MLFNLLQAVAWGVGCGMVGYVYAAVLPHEEPFAPWWRYGQRFETSRPYLFKVLWGCAKCFSGQLANYTWVAFSIATGLQADSFWLGFYAYCFFPFAAAAAICTAIFLTNKLNSHE